MTAAKHGGKRDGAGRKATGITKKVSITLTGETWDKLDQEKQEKQINQSAILRSIIEDHFKPVNDERAVMWWELVRKNILEGFIEVRKSALKECNHYRKYSADLEKEIWQRCTENSRAYSKPRISYLLEAFYFEGQRLLLDKNFESLEEQILFAVIEYVRNNRSDRKE
jgi:hypothetical protein